MVRVFPRTCPPPRRSASVRLELAGGESASFQVVLRPRPGRPLRGVRLELDALRGTTEIPASALEWQQVGYVRVETMEYVTPSGRRPIDANVRAALAAGAEVPGWWPDPLLPVEAFDVATEFAQPVWVTISVPPGTPAGDCSGRVTICADGAPPMSVAVSVTVRPFELPRGAGSFRTAFALMDPPLRLVYGRVDRAMLRRWGAFMLRHRLNPDDIYRTATPDVADLEYFLELGMNSFNVVNNRKTRHSKDLDRVTEDALAQIPGFLEVLRRSSHAARLLDMAYYYGFDEITVDQVGHMRDEFRRVREEFGLPTMTTAHLPQDPADFRRTNTDWLCPITSWLDAAKVARCRAAGFKVWTYTSLEPDPPYANWRFDNPLVEARALFWQCRQQEVDGFLYWGVNAWHPWHPLRNDRPVDLARGPFLEWSVASFDECLWLHGDGVLLYPASDGSPLGCIRLANIRDGLQDIEYLNLLAKLTGRPADAVEACAPVAAGWTSCTRDPAVIFAQRRRLAGRIARLMR